MHRLVTVRADWLLILKAIEGKGLVMLRALELFNLDEVGLAREFHHLMVLSLWVRRMFDFARVTEKH